MKAVRTEGGGESVDIVCSSRELFGADRSAVRLAEVLRELGLTPTIIVPRVRPERGLREEAAAARVDYAEAAIAIASSHGVEDWRTLRPRRTRSSPAFTIVNSAAVLGLPRRGQRTIVVLREWLRPQSMRHRALAVRQRAHATALVGVSTGVLHQWNACVSGPTRRFVVPNWLERGILDLATNARLAAPPREGILFVGRFNAWKGQDTLADAYEAAFADLESRPSLTFVGAQPGTEFAANGERLARRGERWGWRVLPFTTDRLAHVSTAALMVVPSLRPEPFGLVILEALAFGCAVLAFEGGGPTDLQGRFPGALQLTRRSTADLAQALREWWETGGLGQAAGSWAETAQVIDAHYSQASAQRRWSDVLDAVRG